MKRTALIFLAVVLCCSFVACDMGGGLVGELLEQYGSGPGVNHWVEVDPVKPYPDEIYTDVVIEYETVEDDWTEYATDEIWIEETVPVDVTEEISWDISVPDIEPAPSLQDVLIMDGNLDDWNANNWLTYWSRYYGPNNLDAWMGEVDGGFTMCAVADSEYLYLAFYIKDETLVYSESGTYRGDAIQIQMDLDGLCGKSGLDRAIFYSFGLQEDGNASVTVECIQGAGKASVDYVMDSRDDSVNGLKGATKPCEDGIGWIAEIAIPWTYLKQDMAKKLGFRSEDDLPIDPYNVDIVMLVCYYDYHAEDLIGGAWGTSYKKGSLVSNGAGWYPENGGLAIWFDTANFCAVELELEYGK